MDTSKQEDLKTQYPEGKVARAEVRGKAHEVFIRPPTRVEMRRFRQESGQPHKQADAMEHLVRACIVYPDPAGVDAMLDAAPGLVETFIEPILVLSGAGAKLDLQG